jgi:transposase
MSYTVAGIDVHKRLLVVVTADISQPEWKFERRRFSSSASDLYQLRLWLQEQGVAEAVMESTAQYWKPVWLELEGHCKLWLAQAQSNRAPRGRKTDCGDAERLVRRFVAGELRLSFVPEAEQRSWRSVTRARVQLASARVQLQNQVESLLEECRIKLSSVISDLLGVSGRRILRALAQGQTDAQQLAELGEESLRCGRAALADALTGSVSAVHRILLAQLLARIELIDQQSEQLSRLSAQQMQPYQDTILRLVELPGIGLHAAHQIVAEIGPTAAAFASSRQLASWIGVCPGLDQSAAKNHSGRSAKGNRFLRRLLCQAAHAAVQKKGSHLQAKFRKLVVRLGYQKAVWAIAHRLCRIIWNVLRGARFLEYGEAINPKAVRRCIQHHLKCLRRLGYSLPDPLPTAS